MRFGVGYSGRNWRDIPDVAFNAEDQGFDSFFIPDHYMWPTTNDTVDAWMILTYLAAKTSRIRLGTIVTPIPFRHPAMLAKMVTTLDQLSGGRVNFGVGAGWFKPEFDAYSIWEEKYERVAKFREGFQLITRLWSEDRVNFHGKFYRIKDAFLEPKPMQKPHPPIWFGTSGNHMLKLAARYGDGWVSNFGRSVLPNPETVREIVNKLKMFGDEIKRKNPMTIAVGGCLDDGLKRVEQMIEVGCDYYILSVDQKDPGPIKAVTRFAKEILPSFV